MQIHGISFAEFSNYRFYDVIYHRYVYIQPRSYIAQLYNVHVTQYRNAVARTQINVSECIEPCMTNGH